MSRQTQPSEAIVIGASAGALEALLQILPDLPKTYPLPIMIVVHLPPDKKSVMVELMRSRCEIAICEAEDKEAIEKSTVYFAPPDYHLLVESDKRLSLSSEEPVLYSRPSIDVLFETAADAYGPALTGIILTGASSDGALGLKAVMDAGGVGVVQEPAEAFASTMPQSALEACPEAMTMSITHIKTFLQKAASL